LRASHADREQAISTLKAAFVRGMLAKEEFNHRVGQALAARTYADLAVVTADLPAGLAASQPSPPARAEDEQPVLRPGKVIALATALYAGVWPFTFLLPWPMNSEGEPPAAVIMLFLSATFLYLMVLLIAVGAAIEEWWEKRSGGQLPGGQAPGAGGQGSRRLPPAGPGRQLPPADSGHRHAAEAARRRRPRPPWPARDQCGGGALTAGTAPASG
jgi:hypothetical protein